MGRKVSDVGRHAVVEAMLGDTRVAAIVEGETPVQGDEVGLIFAPAQTRVYRDGWISTEAAS